MNNINSLIPVRINKMPFSILKGLIVAICLAFLLAGCKNGGLDTDRDQNIEGKQINVVILLGVFEGAPKPALPTEVKQLIFDALSTNGNIGVIVVDGEPSIAGVSNEDGDTFVLNGSFGSNANYPARRDRDNSQTISSLIDIIENKLIAENPEVYLAKALALADRELRSIQPVDSDTTETMKYLILLTPYISTKGVIDWTQGGMFGVDPDEYANALFETGELPIFEEGVQAKWYFATDVEGDNDKPSTAQSKHIVSVYSAILKEVNLDCAFPADIPGSGAIEGAPPVTRIDIPEPEYIELDIESMIAITIDSSLIHFLGDKAEYIDDGGEAAAVLEPIAEKMKANPGMKLLITGMTATGDKDFIQWLSQARADRVMKSLEELGIDPSRMKAVGVGADDPSHIADTDENGKLIPNLAAQNRAVRLESF